MVWLEDSAEGRVERILRDYVVEPVCRVHRCARRASGVQRFAQRLHQSLANIQKRLGGERFQRFAILMQDALAEQHAVVGGLCTAAGSKAC